MLCRNLLQVSGRRSLNLLKPCTRVSLNRTLSLSQKNILSTSSSLFSTKAGVDADDHFDFDYDNVRQTDRIAKEKGDTSKREFTYLMVGSLRFIYASAIRLGLMKFISSMSADESVLAGTNKLYSNIYLYPYTYTYTNTYTYT